MTTKLPDCGLYRTGIALRGNEAQVPAGILISFHNHSDQGVPMVATPHANENNCWQFHERGWAADDDAFLAALVALKAEGLYINTHHLHVTREEIVPEKTLMQLGYNRAGDSIVFIARFEGNAIVFPSEGYQVESSEFQQHLQPVEFNVPRPRASGSLH